MSRSIAYKHYVRALSRWPKDNLRPECQFREILQKRLDQRFLPASSPDAAKSAQAVPNSAIDEMVELEQVNALYSLLENRYSKTYPFKGSLMNPPSNPTYYTDLIRELEAAPQRSWMEGMTNRWKGFLRFQ